MTQIFKIVYYIVLAFVVLVAILMVVSILPITGNYKVMTVLSSSMSPNIKMGSVVIVKPVSDYKIGDVITFGPYSKIKPPTTHRIFDIKVVGDQPYYITRGDANNVQDSREVSKRDVIGKVLFSVPYIGFAVDFVKKPIGFTLIIVIPASIIIFDEIRKIISEIKKKKNKDTVIKL